MCAKSLQSCLTLWDSMDCVPVRILCPWDSPGKDTGGECHALLQGIFLTQGLNPHLLRLLHWRRILYPWANREATPCPSASGLIFGFPSHLGHHRALSKVPCLIQFIFFSNLFHTQCSVQFSHSVFWLFATPWTTAHQASLSITNSQSLLKLMSIESVLPSNHLILCHPLQSFPASASFQMSQFFASGGQNIEASAPASVLSMNIQDWSPLEWTGWISLLSKGLSRVFSNTTLQKHQFFGAQLSL